MTGSLPNNPNAFAGSTIVLVDDEPHITHMVARKLTQIGLVVHTAGDGQQGLELINEIKPDLVVTDLQMPYMSGIELARRLWDSPKTNRIPVIMLTARGYMVAEDTESLENIRALLSKPFSPRAVVDLVEQTLRETGEERSSAA